MIVCSVPIPSKYQFETLRSWDQQRKENHRMEELYVCRTPLMMFALQIKEILGPPGNRKSRVNFSSKFLLHLDENEVCWPGMRV